MENSKIAILCYTLDNNILDKIALIEDKNYLMLIESDVNPQDSSMLLAAKTVMMSYTEQEFDKSKWKYLGELKRIQTGKTIYAYALDITEVNIENLNLHDLNEVTQIEDSVCQAVFFRLFSTLYKQDILQ